MRYFLIALAVVAVILIIVFRKQIAAFFGWGTPEGSACTDTNGNASIIENGVCKEVVIPNPPQNQNRYYYPQSNPPYNPYGPAPMPAAAAARPGSILINVYDKSNL